MVTFSTVPNFLQRSGQLQYRAAHLPPSPRPTSFSALPNFPQHTHSDAQAKVNKRFREVLAPSRHFYLVESHPRLTITLNKDVLLLEMGDVFAHREKLPTSADLSDDAFLETLPSDTLCFFALKLGEVFGRLGDAASLLAWFFPTSSLMVQPHMLAMASALIFSHDALDVTLERVKVLMREGDLDRAQLAVALLLHPEHLSEEVVEMLGQMLLWAREFAPALEAPLTFNKSVCLRGLQRNEEAYQVLETARTLDPGYEGRYHWQIEKGRQLFFLGRFDKAAACYLKGHALFQPLVSEADQGYELLALAADCLLYAGRYREALKHLDQALASHPALPEEMHLKRWMLEQFVRARVQQQRRDPLGSQQREQKLQTVPDAKGKSRILLECLDQDRLNALAWHDLGVTHLELQGPVRSHPYFFIAAILEPREVLYMADAVVAGLTDPTVREIEFLATCLLVEAYRHHRAEFWPALEVTFATVGDLELLSPLRTLWDQIAHRIEHAGRDRYLEPTPWGVTFSDWLPPSILVAPNRQLSTDKE